MRTYPSSKTEADYAPYRERYPVGKRCRLCGETHDVTAYAICGGKGQQPHLHSYCKDCDNERKRRQDALRREKARADCAPTPLPFEVCLPIPVLYVGKRYVIVDGIGDRRDFAKPVHYVGPCVARWGRNWGIKTSTGIRCFTPSTLVGLQIREVA
jgi:hypothetical protein